MRTEKFAVIGIGQFGKSIALNLTQKGAEVMAIDMNYDRIENISDEVAYAVTLNATDRKALLSQDITRFDAVIVSINPLEQRLLCVALLLDLGVKHIVCRAGGRNEHFILKNGHYRYYFSRTRSGSISSQTFDESEFSVLS